MELKGWLEKMAENLKLEKIILNGIESNFKETLVNTYTERIILNGIESIHSS